MTDRDYVKEEIRKQLTSDINKLSRSVDSTSLARQVDSAPLEKCMLHRYGQYKQGLARTDVQGDERTGKPREDPHRDRKSVV